MERLQACIFLVVLGTFQNISISWSGKEVVVSLTAHAFLRSLQVAKKRKVEEHPAGTGSEVAKDREVEE